MWKKQLSLILSLFIIGFLLSSCGLIPAAMWPSFADSKKTTTKLPTPDDINFPPRTNIDLETINLSAGRYSVGKDETIKPGRYQISGSGSGNVNIYKYSVIYISEILGWPAFGVDSISVDLREYYEVEVSELDQITLKPLKTIETNTVSSGDWVVGLDIKAGRFTALVDESESGRISIYDTSGYIRFSENLGGALTANEISIDLKIGEILIVSNINNLELRP